MRDNPTLFLTLAAATVLATGCEISRTVEAGSRPELTRIEPSAHPVPDGVLEFSADGANFTTETTVVWGDTELPATVATGRSLRFALPPELAREPSFYPVRIRNPHGADSTPGEVRVYEIGPAPVVLGVDPEYASVRDTFVLETVAAREPLGLWAVDADRWLDGIVASDGSEVRVAIDASGLPAGVHPVELVNRESPLSTGGRSASFDLRLLPTVDPPGETLATGGSGFTLPIRGRGFTPAAHARIDDSILDVQVIDEGVIIVSGPASVAAASGQRTLAVWGSAAEDGLPATNETLLVTSGPSGSLAARRRLDIPVIALAASESSMHLYALSDRVPGHEGEPIVLEIDGATAEVLRTWPVPHPWYQEDDWTPVALALTSEDDRLLVAHVWPDDLADDSGPYIYPSVLALSLSSGQLAADPGGARVYRDGAQPPAVVAGEDDGFVLVTGRGVTFGEMGVEGATGVFDAEGIFQDPDYRIDRAAFDSGTLLVHGIRDDRTEAAVGRVAASGVSGRRRFQAQPFGQGLAGAEGYLVSGFGGILEASGTHAWHAPMGPDAPFFLLPGLAADPAGVLLVSDDLVADFLPASGQSRWVVEVAGLRPTDPAPVRWGARGIAVPLEHGIEILEIVDP